MQDFIYWEKQGFNLLCGVHAINSLLQGPYFSRQDMDKIAEELDKEERDLHPGPRPSENFDETGFYSIQVMSKALLLKKLDCSHYTLKNFKSSDNM